MAATHDRLSLRVFGEPAFVGPGSHAAAGLLKLPKRLALLVYLAGSLPRGFRRRDDLLALLWPRANAQHARNSLRQSLHLLRLHLPHGAVVVRGSEEVALSIHALRLDSQLFEEHLDHGREEEALALYGGDFLHRCHLTDAPEFEAWVEEERERLRRRGVRGALVLARRSELDGHLSRSSDWARFAVQHAPFDEDVLHEVVELLRGHGDGAGAARLHAAAAQRFRSQLGIALSPFGPEQPTPAHRYAPRPNSLTPERARAVPGEARRLYLEGRQYSAQRSPATIGQALDVLTAAIRLAPDYAEAHAALAFALAQATVYIGYPGIDIWPRVREHASRAIRLDPTLGEAHAMLAQATLCHDYDWARAEEIYRRALALDPVSDVLRISFALYFLTASGRTEEALAVFDRLRDLMPGAAGTSTYFAMSCVWDRQFARGRDEILSVLAMQPSYPQAYWVHGMALEGLGDFDAAIGVFEMGAALTNGSSLLLSQLARACARAGNTERARRILGELDGRAECAGPAAYYTAEILAALGDTDPAIDRLYAAYHQRNPLMIFAGVMPGLDPLRAERRFRDLLMRLGIRGAGNVPATIAPLSRSAARSSG